MTYKKADEHQKLMAAIENGRDRKEEINAEWDALGLARRIQSPNEMRRVLMTWKKSQLVEFLIHAESDAIKARHEKLNAWADANRIREHALTLPYRTKQHEVGAGDPWNAWVTSQTQSHMDGRSIFMAGWQAHARAIEAIDPKGGNENDQD